MKSGHKIKQTMQMNDIEWISLNPIRILIEVIE